MMTDMAPPQTFPLACASDLFAAIEARTTLGKTLLVVR
jgi:hypothetical protein